MGRDGKEKNFTKPWCMTTVMFLGMSLCLPLAYLEEHRAKKGALTKAEEPLVGGPPEVSSFRLWFNTARDLLRGSQPCANW